MTASDKAGAKQPLSAAFLGTELTQSAAFQMQTLFLIGCPTIEQVQKLVDIAQTIIHTKRLPKVLRHLHLGAEGTFEASDLPRWARAIEFVLTEGFWCTLSFRAAFAPVVEKSGLCRHSRFIPVAYLHFPNPLRLGSNAVLKLEQHAEPDALLPSLTFALGLTRVERAESSNAWYMPLDLPTVEHSNET